MVFALKALFTKASWTDNTGVIHNTNYGSALHVQQGTGGRLRLVFVLALPRRDHRPHCTLFSSIEGHHLVVDSLHIVCSES